METREVYQMKFLDPNGRETDINLWTSNSRFPSKGERITEGHLRVDETIFPQGMSWNLPLIVAILT